LGDSTHRFSLNKCARESTPAEHDKQLCVRAYLQVLSPAEPHHPITHSKGRSPSSVPHYLATIITSTLTCTIPTTASSLAIVYEQKNRYIGLSIISPATLLMTCRLWILPTVSSLGKQLSIEEHQHTPCSSAMLVCSVETELSYRREAIALVKIDFLGTYIVCH
jgi:hypothetical protein